MSNYSIEVKELNKTFGRRLIFENLNFKVEDKGIFGITGANGSGKSTLVKIIAGLLSPTSGNVIHQHDNKKIESEDLHDFIGFVSPYLFMYDEFTAEENLNNVAKIRGIELNKEKVDYLLKQFLLFDRKDDLVKTYSSGMKQRLKFIFSLMHSPRLLILDEPTSNLDVAGKTAVYQIVKEESLNNIILLASNEESDLELCNEKIKMEDFKLL